MDLQKLRANNLLSESKQKAPRQNFPILKRVGSSRSKNGIFRAQPTLFLLNKSYVGYKLDIDAEKSWLSSRVSDLDVARLPKNKRFSHIY